MKKLLIAILALALIAGGKGSFWGWGTEGRLKVVSGGVDGLYAASGVRTGGRIGMYSTGEIGTYTFTVWCKGAGVFTLQQGAQVFTQTCNSAEWAQLTFPQITKPDLELFLISAQLQAGDYADLFCLYPSDFGSCTYFNHVTNPSFEQ